MADWAPALAARIGRAGRAVLVTVAHAAGSTPREPGTAMVVTTDDAFGTIGGGHLEFEAIRIARDALSNARMPAAWLVRFPLAARLGQCCGGVATLAFATADAASRAWLDAAVACTRTATAFALVSRIGGTAEASAHLVVTADHAAGSLGEAGLDSAAIALARPRAQAAAAGAALCAVPGRGDDTLLVHVTVPCDFDVLVFGNGHVGRALVQVLGATSARIRWIDGREADFPAAVPGNVEIVATDAPADELAAARPGAYVVVTTHSHALDYEVVAAALERPDWRYLGLIGSRAKRAQFERRWAARGGVPEAFARVTCPIGAGALALRGKEPGVIAVAAAAEILVLRENGVRDDFSSGQPRMQSSLHTKSRL